MLQRSSCLISSVCLSRKRRSKACLAYAAWVRRAFLLWIVAFSISPPPCTSRNWNKKKLIRRCVQALREEKCFRTVLLEKLRRKLSLVVLLSLLHVMAGFRHQILHHRKAGNPCCGPGGLRLWQCKGPRASWINIFTITLRRGVKKVNFIWQCTCSWANFRPMCMHTLQPFFP